MGDPQADLLDLQAPDIVLYGLLKVEGRILLWSQIPHSVGGVKRGASPPLSFTPNRDRQADPVCCPARALVHERTVANTLRGYTATLSVASPKEFDASAVAIRLFHQINPSPTSRPRTASPPISPHVPSPSSQQHPSIAGSVRRPSVPDTLLAQPASPRANGAAASFVSNPRILDNTQSHHEPAPTATHADASAQPRRSLEQALSPGYPALGPRDGLPTTARDTLPSQSAPPQASSTPLYDSFASTSLHPSHASGPPPHVRPSSASPPVSPGLVAGSPNASGIFESAAAAMLVASASDPSLAGHALSAQGVPVDVAEDDVASVTRAPPPEPVSDEGTVDAHGDVHELEQRARALELEGREEAARLERERRERQAGDEAARAARREQEERAALDAEEAAQRHAEEEQVARRAAEEEYRQQAEAELERERAAEEERLAAVEEETRLRALEEERLRVEAEEEILRREEEVRRAEEERLLHEQRVAEERRLAEEAERVRLEEEERTRRAEEEMRLLIERQRAEKQLREQEEARLQEEERLRAVEERKSRLVTRRDAGEVMLDGTVNVQGGGSMVRSLSLSSTLAGLRADWHEPVALASTLLPPDALTARLLEERSRASPVERGSARAFSLTLWSDTCRTPMSPSTASPSRTSSA